MIYVENDQPVGLVVDLAYAVAEKAHLAIRVEAMEWSAAQALVAAGQADALLQINPTPEREQLYDFSDTLLESHFHLLRKTARVELQGLTSLYGKKVGVERGAGFPILYLSQYAQIQQVVLPSWEAGFQMLQAEQIDAIIVDRWVGEYELYLTKVTGVTVVATPLVTDYSRIAVKKGNRALLERINAGLHEIDRDGTRQRILDKWQAKQVVYLTRESLQRLLFWAAMAGIALLSIIAWRALVHARAMKRINSALAEQATALTHENEERRRAEAALQQANETLEHRVADRTAALQASEGRLQLFVEHAPAAIAMFDVQMRYVAVSRRWMEDYHLAGEAVLGRSHYEVFPEIPEHWRAIHRRCLAGAVEHAEADPFPRADGQVQWLHWEVRPWHTAEGSIGGIIILSEDITARKQAEAALQASEARFRTLIEEAPIAISVSRGGVILYTNLKCTEMFGYQGEALRGRSLLELWAAESGTAAAGRFGPHDLGPLLPGDYEAIGRRQDGAPFPAQVFGTLVDLADGPAAVAFVTDITARKQAEETLRHSEDRYRTLAAATFEGIVVTEGGRITDANAQMARLLGYAPDELLGMEISACLPVEDQARVLGNIQAAAESHLEHELLCKDGSRRTVEAHGQTLTSEGRRIRLTAIRDITTRKQAEAALQYAHAQLERRVQERTVELAKALTIQATQGEQLHSLTGELALSEQRERQRLGQVLHDGLQQFLVAARMHADMVTRRAPGDLRTSCQQVVALLGDAITSSRALTAELSPPILHTAGFVPALEWLARWMADTHHLMVTLHTEADISVTDEAAKVLLFQAVRELLFNAVKHAGVPDATVEVRRHGDTLTIMVADQGAGFDPERAAVTGGTGLGLPTIRQRLEYLGGTLDIASAPGQGRRFTLTVPLE